MAKKQVWERVIETAASYQRALHNIIRGNGISGNARVKVEDIPPGCSVPFYETLDYLRSIPKRNKATCK